MSGRSGVAGCAPRSRTRVRSLRCSAAPSARRARRRDQRVHDFVHSRSSTFPWTTCASRPESWTGEPLIPATMRGPPCHPAERDGDLSRRPCIFEPHDRPPAAAIHRGRAVRPRAHAHRPGRGHRGRGVPQARGLLPPGPRPRSTRRSLDLYERREPVDIVTVAEALERTERPRGGRRPRLPRRGCQPDADRRQRRPLRAHRRAQGGAAEPDRRGRARSPASATRTRPRSRRRSTAPRRSCSRSASGGSRPASRRSRRLLHAAYDRLDYLHAAPGRDQRHPHRLRGPRHADHRAPEDRPRDPRRAARRSARPASRSTSPSTPRSATARASASSASR